MRGILKYKISYLLVSDFFPVVYKYINIYNVAFPIKYLKLFKTYRLETTKKTLKIGL